MTRHSEGPSTQGMTLVRGARQLLTLRGPAGPRRRAALQDLGIITDGALLLKNGKILETGPSRRLENLTVARAARNGQVLEPPAEARFQNLAVPDEDCSVRDDAQVTQGSAATRAGRAAQCQELTRSPHQRHALH